MPNDIQPLSRLTEQQPLVHFGVVWRVFET